MGRLSPVVMYFRAYPDSSSAAADTSNTSSKPSSSRPLSTMSMSSSRWNWPYRAGSGRATV